ncbi:MAG: tetratricopeptide repeat protein, partial [Planctomycetes bacterium]|nr:tetratricopeptide repeat protein [Planctomycetota bacterium]
MKMTKGLQVFNNLISDLERPQPSPTSCFLWLMLVLVITVLAYLPALSGEFLNFDDHKIYEQPLITDFNLENFKAILTPQDAGFNFLFNWLTLLTYQLNWLIAPSFLGFIIFAIACHLLQTVFFWKICRRLSSGLAVTVLSTLLFSLHALHVQHVVWQAARFHLLGVTCCLFSAWNYLLSLDENRSLKLRGFNYLLAVLGFLIIAFGRPFYFIYPLTLPVLDLLKRSKFSAKVILNKLPFFFVLAASLGYAYHSGMMSSRVRPEWLGGSLINTFFSNANLNLEYFRQLLIPSESTLVVPINEANGMFATSGCADLLLLKIPPIIPIALFLFIFISLVYLWKSRKLSAPLILFMGIVIVLLHVQNIPPRRGLAGVFAYRYAVLATAFAAPVIALFFIGLFRFFRRHGINTHIVLCLTAGYILFSFATTVQNVRHFRDSESLWSHHVKMLPNSRAGYYYLGKVYQYIHNDPYRAISAYQKALESPHYWGAGYLRHRLAEAYCQVGEWEKADEELKRIGSRDIAKSKTMRRINATVQENLKMTGSPISTGPVSHDGKRVLFDQVHSVRHSAFSNYTKDSIEYNVVQGYSTLQRFLGELGFSVHNHRFGRITPEVLKDVDVLMVGLMSNEAMPINAEEIETIVEFVRKGGGLQVVSDHTNAYDSADLANRLLADFDIEVLDALIVDKTATKDSWYSPKTFTEHPVTKGISVLVHQAGAALETEYGVAFT